MEIPERIKKADKAATLRMQNALCTYEQNTNGCTDIKCEDCILDAELIDFEVWLEQRTKKIQAEAQNNE